MKIIEQHNIPLAESREILENIAKECEISGQELYYEQKKALEHAQKFTKLSLLDAKEVVKKLKELSFLDEVQIIKICDLLPEDIDGIRAILAKERFKYEEKDLKRVIDIVAQYR